MHSVKTSEVLTLSEPCRLYMSAPQETALKIRQSGPVSMEDERIFMPESSVDVDVMLAALEAQRAKAEIPDIRQLTL